MNEKHVYQTNYPPRPSEREGQKVFYFEYPMFCRIDKKNIVMFGWVVGANRESEAAVDVLNHNHGCEEESLTIYEYIDGK